ncbi:MAG: tetratricopeptide repeat protein [Planctomycetaceae bacterium]|nr:tetratricopeptide repeat protein [Planctomycetaceae bacterium]
MPPRTLLLLGLTFAVMVAVGCSDNTARVRAIERQRQARIQADTTVDHLGEVHSLLSRLIELNPQEAQREVIYHLNRWGEGKEFDGEKATPLLKTISEVIPEEQARELTEQASFVGSDTDYLRDCYLFRQISEWVDRESGEDPMLTDWLNGIEAQLPEEEVVKLRTAVRLFDWTIRNVGYEPLQPETSLLPHPPFPGGMATPEFSLGMKFQGPGYRQTDYETVWRGLGDSQQRAGVFTQLCRQAYIPAFVLATQSDQDGTLTPWSVGVLIGKEVYLFEPELGCYVPGPGQVGIATLSEARSDASVLRRLNVVSYFEYPVSKSDVQQSIALLNVTPEAVSLRMKQLESGLTGNRRMKTFVDVDALAAEIDAVPGIAGVRLWDVPVLAEVYAAELKAAAMRDPLLSFWSVASWAILDGMSDNAKLLALARWRHLHGQFDKDDEEDAEGARVLYLQQRAPEFEIEDLGIDVNLQKAYGVRRELGMDQKQYEMQLRYAQDLMRMGKNAATYWVSLIQYDDERYETAQTWFSKRVLDSDLISRRELTGDVLSPWVAAARYNLARSLERSGKIDEAIQLYKTDGDPQEHGNRLRARLLDKRRRAAETEPAPEQKPAVSE